MKFILNKDNLTVEDEEVINSGSVNYYEADVEYDESWNNLTIKAILIRKNEEEGKEIAVIGNKIFLDKEMLINEENYQTYYIGFVGYTIENELKTYQISTKLAYFSVIRGAGEVETQEPELPTPTEWEKYMAEMQKMVQEAQDIFDKISDIGGGTFEEEDPTVPEHVKNIQEQDINNWNSKASISDMTNYIEEHKDELKGDTGPQGEQGPRGEQGIQGEQGLKGDKGDKGDTGPQGEPGKDGANGKDGEDGQDGYTPVKGTDYYTEEDKEEMVNLILEALPSSEEVSY